MSKSIQAHNFTCQTEPLALKKNPSVQAYHAKHWYISCRQRNTARSNPIRILLHLLLSNRLLCTLCHSQNSGHNPFCIYCYFYTPDVSLSHQYYRFHDSSVLAD